MSRRERNKEEILKKKTLFATFRKVVQTIIFNNCLLSLEDEDRYYQKKHLSFVMRRKRKIGALTAADRGLIRMNHKDRTVADKKKLCSIFTRLRCFSKFPPKVRARLVPVIKLMSIEAGRVIMAKGDMPFTAYFILTGEVQMIKRTYSKLYEKNVDEVESIFGPGDCIGDVALLDKTIRSYTFLAASQCELLVLFDNAMPIIEPFMRKLLLEKKRALKALDYFDFFNEDQISNACRFGAIRQYNPLDTIYSQDMGSLTNVHFVLSGECIILQCLNMKVTVKNGKKAFRLTPWKDDDAALLLSKTSSYLLSEPPVISEAEIEIHHLVKSSSSSEADKTNKNLPKMGIKGINRLCGLNKLAPKTSHHRTNREEETPKRYFDEQYDYLNFTDSDDSAEEEELIQQYKMDKISPKVENYEVFPTESEVLTITSSSNSSSSSCKTSDSDADNYETLKDKGGLKSPKIDKHETHFIDVGSLTFGGIFGLGEKMQDRAILARTTVHCLTLPRYFLMEKKQNPGNIWQRRLFYLDCTIPSREALFTEFLNARNWREFKKNHIYNTLTPNVKDISKHYDIPIICRIVENVDDD